MPQKRGGSQALPEAPSIKWSFALNWGTVATFLSLKEAADELIRTRHGLLEREPFFFIVGAGVSAPNIKTASQFLSDFINKYEDDRARYGLSEVTPPSTDYVDQYSFWFEKAYPQPIMRRNFLKERMSGVPPSPAVLRLAHLATSKKLSSLIITELR